MLVNSLLFLGMTQYLSFVWFRCKKSVHNIGTWHQGPP